MLAGIAIQRAMASHRTAFPDNDLHVRLGIHTGEVVEDDGDIFGANVITAVRIAGVARPDEVLVSGLTRDLTESSGDLSFDEGREANLKGLSRPPRCARPPGAEARCPATTTAGRWRCCSAARPGGRSTWSSATPTAAARHPQRPTARRRHADADPLLAGGGAGADGGGAAGSRRRRPAGGGRVDPNELAAAHERYGERDAALPPGHTGLCRSAAWAAPARA